MSKPAFSAAALAGVPAGVQVGLPSASKLRSVRNRSMSSDELETHMRAASGPVTSTSFGSGGVESAMPMPGLMPPPITCEEAAELEPMVPSAVAG